MFRIRPILIVFTVCCTGRVLACSCMVSGTVDQEYAKAVNVVVLKVRSMEKTEAPPPMLVNYGGIKQTTLTVEKVYKGRLKVGQELVFAQGGGADCIWTFTEESVGEEYLFYLGAKPSGKNPSSGVIAATGQFPKAVSKDVWIASTCSRSNALKWAAADVLYLNKMAKVAGQTRLSGAITKRAVSAVEGEASSYQRLAETDVLVTGNGKTIKLKTDENGVYEVYNLAPGKYQLRPDSIEGFKLGGPKRAEDRTVTVRARSHTEQNLDFEIDSSIGGKFYDANGRPLKDVCVKLVPTQGEISKYVVLDFDCTNADGSFQMTEIPTGSYYLLFNYSDKVTATTPFRSFFYPKTRQRENASAINVQPGTHITDLIVVAPDTEDVITVTGILRMQDGKAADGDIDGDGAGVEFIADSDDQAPDASPTSRGDVDSQGRFTIRILNGQKGKLYGTITTFAGDYENCPMVEKLIPKKDTLVNIVDIKTPVLIVDAQADQTGVELKFPFPKCKKAKID